MLTRITFCLLLISACDKPDKRFTVDKDQQTECLKKGEGYKLDAKGICVHESAANSAEADEDGTLVTCKGEYDSRGGNAPALMALNNECMEVAQARPLWDMESTNKPASPANCCVEPPELSAQPTEITCKEEYDNKGGDILALVALNIVCKVADLNKPLWDIKSTNKPASAANCCKEHTPATCDSYATANGFGALVFKLTKCAQESKVLDITAGGKVIPLETIAGWKNACCIDMTCKQYDDGNSANLQTDCDDSGGSWDNEATYTGSLTDCCNSSLTCQEKFDDEVSKRSGINAMLNARLSLNNNCTQEYPDNSKPVWDIKSTNEPASLVNCCIPSPDRWTPSPTCAQEYTTRGGDENAQTELNEVCKLADRSKPVWMKFSDKKAHADNCCEIGPTCHKEYFDRGNNADAQTELNEVCKLADRAKSVWDKTINDKPAHATNCCRTPSCVEEYNNKGGNEDAQVELDKVCENADPTKPVWEHFAYTTASAANCCRSGHDCSKEYLNRKRNSDATSAQKELNEICIQAKIEKSVWDLDSKNKPATAKYCCVKGCAEVCSDWNLENWQWKPTTSGPNPRTVGSFEKVTDKCPDPKNYDEPKSYLKTGRTKTRECSNLKEGQECFAINSETRLTPCCQEKFVCGGRHSPKLEFRSGEWRAESYSYTGIEGAWWDNGKCNCLKPYVKSADGNQGRLIVVSERWVFDSETCNGRCVGTENTDHFPKNLPEFIYAVVELDQLGWWKNTDTYPEGGRTDYENRVIAPNYGENLRVAIRFRVNREFEQPDLRTKKSIELQCELQEATDDTKFTLTTSMKGQVLGCNDKYTKEELSKLIQRNQAIPEIKIKIISDHPKPTQKNYIITSKEPSLVEDEKCVVTKSRYPYSGYDEKEAIIRQLNHTYQIPRSNSLSDEDNYFYFNMNYLINVDSADQIKRTFVWGATECEKSTRHVSWGAVREFDKSLHIGKKLSNNSDGQQHTDAAINFIKIRINPDPDDRTKITAPITYEYEVKMRGQLVHQFRTPAIQQQIIKDHFPEDL